MGPRVVYVVDDDQAVLDSMAFLLESLGYQCELFSDPAQFLTQAEGLNPGCLITDLRMPQMTGFELVEALRRCSIGWPTLLMTSDNGPGLQARAKAQGFAGYLRKPVEVSSLIDALDEAFRRFEDPHVDA